jgi:hypothetical protein
VRERGQCKRAGCRAAENGGAPGGPPLGANRKSRNKSFSEERWMANGEQPLAEVSCDGSVQSVGRRVSWASRILFGSEAEDRKSPQLPAALHPQANRLLKRANSSSVNNRASGRR